MKNTLLTLTVLSSLTIFSACARQDKAEATFDAYMANSNSQVLNADSLPNNSAQKTASNSAVAFPQPEKGKTLTRNGFDNSNIATMVDGFGNKVEARFFDNNPRVISVTLRTTVNGETTADIMGRNGKRLTLPPEMFERAMTATANELADKLGIIAPPVAAPVQQSIPVQQPLPVVEKVPGASLPPAASANTTETAQPIQPVEPVVTPSPLQSNQPNLQSLPR
jgi:hypothetical protein